MYLNGMEYVIGTQGVNRVGWVLSNIHLIIKNPIKKREGSIKTLWIVFNHECGKLYLAPHVLEYKAKMFGV